LEGLASLIKNVVPARYRPIGYLLHLTRTRTDSRVCRGPFAGVRYVEDSIGSAYIPKLLGIYESELTTEVENICKRKPGLIVDIGAAEGYYAIGLAVRNPQARVVAFEMEPAGRTALYQMAALNEVTDRVEVRGKCEPPDLASTLVEALDPIVICDAEGYEEKLLDPLKVPALGRAVILAELHDFIVPGITEQVKRRFEETHRIRHIWQQPRSRDQFPWRTLGTTLLPKSYLDWSVSEWRPVRMSWLWMEPYS
jgi:precorrin-6B methylase 2